MPSLGTSDTDRRARERMKAKQAKLRAKGIIEGSSKWFKLLHRR